MDEKKFLEHFAKILGSSAQEELKKIEEKRLKEERLLKSFGAALSKKADFEIKIKEEIQPPKQIKLPDEFIKKAPQIIVETPIVHIETISEPVVKEVVVEPPVLEVANLVSQAVSATNVPEDGKKTEADLINASLRKEIEVIKKSVADFHKLVHDQSRKIALAGSSHGGGEVNLRYLDDIDRSSIRQGHFLTYDNSTKKFIFSQIAEGNVDLSHIDQQLTPGANGVYNIGSPTDYWANVYADSLILDGGGIEANGSFGNNGQVLTSNGSSIYWNTPTPDRLVANGYEVILATTGQLNLPSANNTESKNARIQSSANIDILSASSLWTFGTDSVLTLPEHGKIIFNSANPEQYIEGTMGFHIHASDSLNIDVGSNTYSFDNNGVFTLPQGGDIQNSSGHSVITDLLHVPSNIIPNSTYTYNLGNTSYSWANAYVQTVNIPTGTIISGANTVEVIVAPLILDSIVDTSTGVGDNLNIGDYGLRNGIPHPWTVYKFTTNPDPVLEINDVISGAGVPVFSGVKWIGTGANAAIVIANTSIGDISQTAWPQPLQYMYVVRAIVNAGLAITTRANTDITLNPGPGGFIVPHADIVPYTDQGVYLGSPTKRFKGAYFGANTIYVLDEVKGTDIGIGAANNLLYITGSAGIKVGEFTLRDNQIAIANNARDILFGTTLATGNVVFNRPISVKSYDTGKTTFAITRSGRITINTPDTILNSESAVSIVGTSSGYEQPRNFTGTLLQATAQNGQPARISIDSFGTGTYGSIATRAARGTVDTPLPTANNDTLLRLTSQGWTNNTNQFIGTIVRINFEAAQDFNSNAAGTRISFQTTPLNSNVIQTSAFIDSTGITVPNNITTKTITANGSIGKAGQVLSSNGTVVYWANTNVVNAKTVTSSNYTILDSDYYVGINLNGAVTVTLPSSTTSGRNLIIKDESGNCINNPITVSGNVDNDPSGFILTINNGGIHMLYNNGSWRII